VIHRVQSDQLHPTPGYHHITIAQPGELIFLAGQMPMDDSGERVVGPDDLDAQVDRTVLNTQHALAVAEVRPEDVVRSVVYVVGTDTSQLGRAWHRFAASPRHSRGGDRAPDRDTDRHLPDQQRHRRVC
jgi:enamine deaminase RidA (YjgF/YER057c/UK114 family)